jgi:hypothetical protein
MPELAFKRPAHRQVAEVMGALDASFLDRAHCYFAGGTRIVLELGEYRESRDVDFMCADRDGYRLLREAVSAESLGPIASGGISLAREVRADQYGIRTFLDMDGSKFKFEILRENRIELEGEEIARIPVPCLTRKHCFAEKFLANADRGLDASTLSRDIVDLAFMMQGWPRTHALDGLALAESAYGSSVKRSLAATVAKMQEDRAYRNRCVDGLGLEEVKPLTAGIRALGTLL